MFEATLDNTPEIKVGPIFMVMGLVSLALGIAVLVWPEASLKVVTILIGLQILFYSLLRIIVSIAGSDGSSRFLGFLVGLLGVVVGVLVMRSPLRTVAIVVTLIGVYWVFWGVAGLISGFFATKGTRLGVFISSLVTLALGLVLLSWPEPTVRVIAVVVGVFLIAGGLADIALGAMVRSEEATA